MASRVSAKWSDSTDLIFIDLCLEQKEKGNRPGSSLSKEGWKNVVKEFNLKTGSQLDQKQLKNRWDQMKKEWSLYKNLMYGCSGIGWNPITKTIEASNEWWEEKIKVDSKYKKFRNRDLTIVQTKYEELFRDTVATGERAKASTQRSAVGIDLDNQDYTPNLDDLEHDNAEGSGDSDEVQPSGHATERANLFPPPSFQTGGSSGSKRKRSNTSSIKDGIQSLLNIAITKSTETSSYTPSTGPTIEECMQLLGELEGVEKYTSFYYFSQSLFEKSSNRKIFMAQPDDRARVGWLGFKFAEYQK